MAKKKQTRKKKAAPVEAEPSTFWPLAGAIFLIILAFLLLLGGFGTGGPLPVDLFKGAYWALGWAAYLTPVALVYWGVYKFKSEDRQIPLGKLWSMIGVLVFAAAWLHVSFASQDPSAGWIGGHGGREGRIFGGALLSLLDKFPAGILFFVLMVLAAFFAFGISPKVILSMFGRREGEEDSDLAALKAKAEGHGFQLNEGVPVEHHSRVAARLSYLKKSAQ